MAISDKNHIGMSDFARKQHNMYSGNSFTTWPDSMLFDAIKNNWKHRIPGTGESGLDRKVLVPIKFGPGDFYMPTVDLDERMPVHARVTRRQDGEKPYVETFVYFDDLNKLGIKLKEPKFVNIVCYSAEALLENDGKRSTECDWEVVCILASKFSVGSLTGEEPMSPLTMARNFLGEVGGTKSNYTAQEFAEAIWYNSINRGIKVLHRPE